MNRFVEEDGDSRARYVLIENNLDESAADLGCDRHPNVNGHRKTAAQLVKAVAGELDW